MIVVVKTVEISVPGLFLHDRWDIGCLNEHDVADWLTHAFDSVLPKVNAYLKVGGKRFHVHGLEVQSPDQNGLSRFNVAVSSDLDDYEYLPNKRVYTVAELRESIPEWLWDIMDEVNGTKINWSPVQ